MRQNTNHIKKIINWCFSKRALPFWGILILDCLIILFSGIVCYIIDWGLTAAIHQWSLLLKTLCVYLLCYFVGFRVMRTYSGVLRYSSFIDLLRIGAAMLIGVVLIASLRLFLRSDEWLMIIRFRELFGTFVCSTILMCAVRIVVKVMYDQLFQSNTEKRAFIYGVKRGGIGLAKSIKNTEPRHYSLQGFVSDHNDMVGKVLLGVTVYKNDERLIDIIKKKHIQVFLVSPLKQKDFIADTALVDNLIKEHISIYFINSATQWNGKSNLNVNDFKEVEIEDLLPRAEIQVDMQSIATMLHGRSVLITGSAGSIGSEMVRQIATLQPANMILVDEAETPQHDIRLMMAKDHSDVPSETIVTSICREDRMEHIFKTYRPDYVFHAAAYKHVPMMEDNPCEAVENNIAGTKIIADLAVKYGVKKFVMISTDKAVNPTNVMGCSKRICEMYVQSLDKYIKDGKIQGCTQFVTTRFGNVLGSNGSVIPLFRKQILAGGPVTVTHPDIVRYFMLISEACKLVLDAGTMGNGGEIYVFDMGAPVKIADMAQRMIRLSGATDIKIEYTGLRNGEKLYEEVLDDEENTLPTDNSKIKVAKVRPCDFDTVSRSIDDLIKQSHEFDEMKTVAMMKALVPEYKSQHSKYEILDK